MDIDESFENNNNNVFKLDFDKYLHDGADEQWEKHESEHDLFINSNYHGFNNDLFSRQNSFNLL